MVNTVFWFIEGLVNTGFWFIEGLVNTGFWFIKGLVNTGFWNNDIIHYILYERTLQTITILIIKTPIKHAG